MDNIPGDIFFNIFTRLRNTCQLLALRSVCKQWRDMIDDPSLFDAHIARIDRESSAHLEDWRVYAWDSHGQHFYSTPIALHGSPDLTPAPDSLHSCYGLLLCCYDDGNLYVNNPVTGSLWNLPPLDPDLLCSGLLCRNPGIGYDPYSRAFKIIVFRQDNDRNTDTVFVHTLGSSEWRVSENVQLPQIDELQAAVYLNGCMYWKTFKSVVICMDLREEKIEETPHPLDRLRKLLIWDGTLAASCMVEHASTRISFDMWVLKDSTWIKVFEFGTDFLAEYFMVNERERTPVAGVGDGRVVLFVANHFRRFIYYDVENMQVMRDFGFGEDRYRYSSNHFSHLNTMTKKVTRIHV